jgi:hypothetical protein
MRIERFLGIPLIVGAAALGLLAIATIAISLEIGKSLLKGK